MNKLFCLMVIVLFSIAGCQRRPSKPDISGIKVNIGIKRLDVDLFKVTDQNEQT